VRQLGVERMSKSQVSRLARSLDQIVEDSRTRPLDAAPYPYLVLDALEVKCREGGRTVNACVVHAVAVNRDGFRESLGLDVVTSEDGAAWLAFLRSLVARGLTGVRLVTSDAHPGPSTRSRRRCRARASNDVGRTSCATCSPASRRARRASSRRWCARSSPSQTPTRSTSSTAASSRNSRAASRRRRRCSRRRGRRSSPSPASRRSTGASSGRRMKKSSARWAPPS
jgi:hypothetical protein